MIQEVKSNKRYFISIIEYAIMNNNWEGFRMGRVEVYDNESDSSYAMYEGFIRLPDKAFEQLRDELDFKYFDKLPYLRFDITEVE